MTSEIQTIIDIIGVPLDFGGNRRGVDMGPSAIRYAGLQEKLEELGRVLGFGVEETGNVDVPLPRERPRKEDKLKYLDEIVEVNRQLAERVRQSLSQGRKPLVLGGDHSMALGSVTGASIGRRLGLVWIDAHGDFNTHQTTPSGNIHGMPLAALCGLGARDLVTLKGEYSDEPKVRPHNVVLVGIRDLDAGEKKLLREAGVAVFSMEAIDRSGIVGVMEDAVREACRGTDGVWVSLDLDSVDPTHAPGVGTPVPGGLTVREAHVAMEMLHDCGKVVGMDMVEVNPILDTSNTTAALAVEFALSAFGKMIWEAS